MLWEWDNRLYPIKPSVGGYQDPATRKILEDANAEIKRRRLNKRKRSDYLSTISHGSGRKDCPDHRTQGY